MAIQQDAKACALFSYLGPAESIGSETFSATLGSHFGLRLRRALARSRAYISGKHCISIRKDAKRLCGKHQQRSFSLKFVSGGNGQEA